ncbi:hypothetical protein JCM8097_006354 [Rhodosporidiobolus ruineniae]
MPPSPPPLPSLAADPADSAPSEQESVRALLRLIEGAVPPTRTSSALDPSLPHSSIDLAAESLAQRHISRRDREREAELNWDEQDNARRARQLLDRLFAAEDNPYSHEAPAGAGEDDDEMDMDEIETFARDWTERWPSLMASGTSLGGGDLEEEDEEEEGRMLGFDGDELELDDYADMDDYTTIWPGFVGQRPLNADPPATVAPPAVSSSSSSSIPPWRALARDPSSALSYTSFLAPGTAFVGEQRFGREQRAAARQRESARATRSAGIVPAPRTSARSGTLTNFLLSQSGGAVPDWLNQALGSEGQSHPTTSHPEFAPYPAASSSRVAAPDVGPSSSLAIPRPLSSSSSSSRYAPYAAPPPPAPQTVSPSWFDLPTPASATPSSSSSASSLSASVRARARIAALAYPPARSSRSSWREVGDELLARTSSTSRTADAGARTSGRGAGEDWKEQEQWGVKIIIQSYDPSAKLLSGVMRAHGVAAPPVSASSDPYSIHPARPPPSDVLTSFTGHLIDPVADGLFVSPSSSPAGVGGKGEFKVSRQSEAESWAQLGPFKPIGVEEILRGGRDPVWCEENTRGWVLFRLKERGFVNVTEKESSLSIAGHYNCVLDRSTGAIEGLYCDPTATPFQRLDVSPMTPSGGYALGTFELR